jgi:hypothetical protein
VDDLDLSLKDPAPKVDMTDVSKSASAPGKANQKPGLPNENAGASAPGSESDDELAEDALEDLPAGGSSVTVEVDKVTLLPGAMASGTVTFSDGVTGKWVVDQYGRPGFTEISRPGYRPSAADSQAFVQVLSAQLQKRGF